MPAYRMVEEPEFLKRGSGHEEMAEVHRPPFRPCSGEIPRWFPGFTEVAASWASTRRDDRQGAETISLYETRVARERILIKIAST